MMCGLLLWAATSLAGTVSAPTLADQEVLADSRAKSRVRSEPGDLVLHYGGEWHGELGTCGCSVRPRGSMARAAGWSHLVEGGGAQVLRLDGGGATDARDAAGARYVKEAWRVGGWHAVNLTPGDLAHWVELGLPEQGVSANLSGLKGVERVRLFERGGLQVAVTGVSAPRITPLVSQGIRYTPPVAALQEVLATVQADVVVVLAHGLSASIADLALPGVDVIIDSNGHALRYEPRVVGSSVVVRSRDQTLRLGELHLSVTDGVVTEARDRRIDLDDPIPEHSEVRSVAREADRAKGG